MRRKKRKYTNKRDWKKYNEELVMRGYFYINPRFLETWTDEIKSMNARKIGNPYLYPKSMIEFLGILHCKSFDYRALEGLMMALSEMNFNFPVIDYSTICRRVNKLNVSFPVENDNVVFNDIIGSDATGIKVSNRGEWIRHKWKVQRGWIKVTMMGNKKGKIIDVIVGTETMNENSAFRKMLKLHHEIIGTVYGDGTYDTKLNFELCRRLKINPLFKIRENASSNANGSMFRKGFVQEYKKLGYEKWSKKNKYGNRWLCTEVIFSAVKRINGEYVRATKKENMLHEAKMKFWAYNKIKKLLS